MKILVLEEFAERYPSYLKHLQHEVTYATSIQQTGRHYDVLLAQPDLAAEYLRDGGQVRWIQSTWAGVRPLAESTISANTLVTGVKEIFGGQIAEYVFTYLLDEIRTPGRYRAAQSNRQWQQIPPETLLSRRMVIVGTGSIGRRLASVARTFGLHVTGVSRSGNHHPEFDDVVKTALLQNVLQNADYIILVLPDTPETKHLFSAETFAAMDKHPLLINAGRGSTIDHDALISALRDQRIRAAVLDVFEEEPLPANHALWTEPNVTITPHIAAVSFPADIARLFLSNLEKFRHSQPLDFVIDLSRGY
ncbi:MAG: D-2-hydroxyacid dehydrogenase [Pseudomonadota bacterium]